jgi:hypothetical protein
VTIVAALVVSGWPDLSTLSVRLVIASAILFAFPTAVAAHTCQNLSTTYGAEILTSRRNG